MKKYLIIIISLFLTACEQYFVPDIDTQKSNLVFEGYITDQLSVQTVKISRTYTFREDSLFETVGGFNVAIEDEFHNKISLNETSKGIYTSDSVQGVDGVRYRMVAQSPEGEIYQSDWEQLNAGAPVDTIYGRYDEEKYLDYNQYSGYVERMRPGLLILNDANTNGYTPYYRYEYNLVFLNIQIYPTQPFETLIYIASPAVSKKGDYLTISNANEYANHNIKGNEVKFIAEESMAKHFVIDSIELDSTGEPLFEASQIQYSQWGFLVQLEQYSLSEKGYNFWNAINKQTQATGQIFDPVQSQIEGNITCITDSTELVFGYFGASAVTKKAMLLNLKHKGVVVKSAKYFPDVKSTMVSYGAFDFWVF